MLRLLLATVVALALAAGAQAQAAYTVTLPEDLSSRRADAAFARGVELLHSFEYDDARDAFREARRLEPASAMAAWGEAMTHNHPVWMRQDREAGLDVLAAYRAAADSVTTHWASVRAAEDARLEAEWAEAQNAYRAAVRAARAAGAPRPAPPRDPRRGPSPPPAGWSQGPYIAAVETLFGAPGSGFEDATKEDRDDAYLAAVAGLADRRSSDRDLRAFHALALLGSAHEGRDYEVYGRAAEIAQSVLDEDREHPGALHYLIHAYDDPDHAELALPAARAYSEIASAASHALHMPTHIYFALGLWEEASALNTRAFEAARDASARRGEPLNNHGWHALYWLAYSELQLGRGASALALLDTARTRYAMDPSRLARTHLVRIRAQLAADADLRLHPDAGAALAFVLPHGDVSPMTQAIDLAAMHDLEIGPVDGLLRLHDLAAADDASPTLRALAHLYPLPVDDGVEPEFMASLMGPEAFQSHLDALALVEATPIAFGPPTPTVLPHEWLGLAYLLDRQPDVVRCLLDAAERRAPNRRMTNRLRAGLADFESTPDARRVSGDPLPVPALCEVP